jgi:hypothetical protein
MRVQCPQCQTTLQLPQAPPAGARIQCASCGAQFGVRVPAPQPVPVVATVQPQPAGRAAVRPVILPPTPGIRRRDADTAVANSSTLQSPAPRAIRPNATTSTAIPVAVTEIPVAVTEIPEAVVEVPGEPAEPFQKKKKRRRFRRSSGGGDSFWTSPGAKLIVAGVFLALVVGAGFFFGVGKLGFLRKGTLTDFNNELIGSVNRLQMAAMPLQNQINNPEELLRGFAALKGNLATTMAEVRNISPPSEGKAFYDAVVRFLERFDRFINTEVPQIESMLRNGRMQEAGQLLMESGSEIQRLETEYLNAQKELARKHGFKLADQPGRRRGW